MPDPNDYESEDEFIPACIGIVMKEGTAKDNSQAAAICHSMWDEHTQAAKAAIWYEAHKADGIWLTQEQMEEICPDCAIKMKSKGLKSINIFAVKAMPEQMLQGLCDKFGPDPGFWTRCQESSIPIDDKESFCAWLHNECLGYYPGSAEDPSHQKAERTFAVKAVEGEEWELDVLGVPFGGPINGKDSDGEYFSPRTKLHLDRFSKPLVTYYHGWDPQGNFQGDPETIGEVKSHEKKEDGVWYKVILDKTSQFAKRVYEAAKKGYAFASSGSIGHLKRPQKGGGEILNWPAVELALVDAREGRKPRNHFAVALPAAQKAYRLAGLELPDLSPEANELEAEPEADNGGEAELQSAPETKPRKPIKANSEDKKEMEKQEVEKLVADALKAESDARAAAEAAVKAEQERIDAAVKAEKEKWEAEAAKANRLPSGAGATPLKFSETDKYDNLNPGEHAFMIDVYEGMRKKRSNLSPPISDAALKAFALKVESEAAKEHKPSIAAVKAMRAVVPDAIKSYEINYSTYSTYGSQWVGTLYHTDLWEKIRGATWVVQELESKGDVREVPAGFSSDTVPLESGDPTWYNIAEATAYNSTTLRPNATITSSLIGTSSKNVTLGKMGCRVIFTGELIEDSLINWVPNAYRQIQTSGAEQLEYLLIDGDTVTTQYLNINDQGGTPTAGDLFLALDGFRKLCLATNTANKRDGGALDVSDFLETLKLMGNAGKHGADPTKVTFIVDPWTYWKTLELDEVKTKDVFSAPTIENGQLTGLWGYPLKRSYFMHYAGIALGSVSTAAYMNKACTTGYIDQNTEGNNTKGAILAVRWDQWALRWKRRMSLEVERWADADANQIVAIMRLGLGYRDTEASAITYNLTV